MTAKSDCPEPALQLLKRCLVVLYRNVHGATFGPVADALYLVGESGHVGYEAWLNGVRLRQRRANRRRKFEGVNQEYNEKSERTCIAQFLE
jgi:hypothetical protein